MSKEANDTGTEQVLPEKVRTVLNDTGFPFQHWCSEIIANIQGYEAAMEVPFTFPKSNGPILGTPGQIDILACAPSTERGWQVCLVIECKRASEKIKHWVMLPNPRQSPKWPTLFFSNVDYQQGVTRSVVFPDLGYLRGSDFDYAIHGIELNSKLAVNRESEEKMFKPMKQVAHASRGLESQVPTIIEEINAFRPENRKNTLYIPVIVTTADLYLGSFSVGDVLNGDIEPSKLKLGEPKKWLTFEFPLPDYLSYNLQRDGGTITVGKRTLFVVNAKSLSEFCENIRHIEKVSEIPRE